MKRLRRGCGYSRLVISRGLPEKMRTSTFGFSSGRGISFGIREVIRALEGIETLNIYLSSQMVEYMSVPFCIWNICWKLLNRDSMADNIFDINREVNLHRFWWLWNDVWMRNIHLGISLYRWAILCLLEIPSVIWLKFFHLVDNRLTLLCRERKESSILKEYPKEIPCIE